MKLYEFIRNGNVSIHECVEHIARIILCPRSISVSESDGLISIRFSTYDSVDFRVGYKDDKYHLVDINKQYPFVSRILEVINTIDVEMYSGIVAMFKKFMSYDTYGEVKLSDKYVPMDDKKRLHDVLYKSTIVFSYVDSNKINEYAKKVIQESEFNSFVRRQTGWNSHVIEGASGKPYKSLNLDYNREDLIIRYPDLSRGSVCSNFWPVSNIEDIKKDNIQIGEIIVLRNKNSTKKEDSYTIIDKSTEDSEIIYAIRKGKTIHFLISEYLVDCSFDDLYVENRKQFNASMRNKKIYIGRKI